MAVFTQISDDEIANLLAWLPDAGKLVSAQGVASGVENTTYLLDTSTGNLILTLFENRRGDDNPAVMAQYMAHLNSKGVACPAFLKSVDGCSVFTLHGKQAGVQTFLPGKSVPLAELNAAQCESIGKVLAQMHLEAKDFPCDRQNPVGFKTWQQIAHKVKDAVVPPVVTLIDDVINTISPVYTKNYPQNLPHGAVHADVFPDNVFYEGDTVSGVIDFGFVCDESWLYDLCVTLHAFAFDDDGNRRDDLAKALLRGYESLRPLTGDEKTLFPIIGQAAALRIFLTRLHDWVFPAEGATVTAKDPMPYANIISYYRELA
jgi:homoserine kinase type II